MVFSPVRARRRAARVAQAGAEGCNSGHARIAALYLWPAFRSPAMNAPTRIDTTRTIRAPRGTDLSCKSWLTEAAFRMLQNNLDPDVAENPSALVVYGGIGRAARNWECFDAILR